MDFLSRKVLPLLGIGSLVLGGCGDDDGATDAGGDDAGGLDSGGMDSAMPDAGTDAGSDAGSDAGMDAGMDAGPGDAAVPDANTGVDVSAFVTNICAWYILCDEEFEYTQEECEDYYTPVYNDYINRQVLADGAACLATIQPYFDCMADHYDSTECTLPDEYCVEEYAALMAACPTDVEGD